MRFSHSLGELTQRYVGITAQESKIIELVYFAPVRHNGML